jgi:hypothetical protein
MRIHLETKELKKSLRSIGVVALALLVYFYIQEGKWLISDSLCLSGILFFSVALWRVVRVLGLFDRTIHSFRLMTGGTKQDFYEYTQENPYTERYLELLICSVVFILISLIL